MTPLTSYSKNGSDFTLVERKGDWAVFVGQSRTNPSKTWECIHVRVRKASEVVFPGRDTPVVVEAAEHAPSNEEWGTHGKTFTSLKDAEARLNQIAP